MVGPCPLAPHHDHLQYIHHVHLMQRGQNRGVTNIIYGWYKNNQHDPSFQNYEIMENTYVVLRQSFLSELQDQLIAELPILITTNTYIHMMILPFGIT